MSAAEAGGFDVLLVDDLSRLARDNFLMLSIMAELRFNGVSVISVADGLDTEDEESHLGIQIRGIFNELQLRDLRKKTLRGQIGQKERGFSVGERTFGYKSVPVGELRMDKKGRPRPEGYKPVIEPGEASVVLRVFREYVGGSSITGIVRTLNEEGVPGQFRSNKGWSPATISRMLRNEKYVGKWIWNRTETRRDPRTGRRRQFPKPESEWIIHEDETLRIVPQPLWNDVEKRLAEMSKTWPGGKGKRGFETQQASRVKHYPRHILSGAMICGVCGASIAQVSGKSGGYYGCLAAAKRACQNRLLVRRTLCERIILTAVRENLTCGDNLRYVFKRVEREIAQICSQVPEMIELKRSELEAEERRVSNFVQFIGEGRGSKALSEALAASEQKVEALRLDLEGLTRSQQPRFKAPPEEWIKDRVSNLQEVLESRTHRSALILRKLLGPIRLEPTAGHGRKQHYRAVSSLNVLPLLEETLGDEDAEEGSNSFHWWRRRESNPRPKIFSRRRLHACSEF